MADDYRSPWADRLAAQQTAAAAPVAPMYSADEIAQRKGANQRAYQWGLLGLMMGDEGQQRAGAQVLQQALGSRQERVTDKGTFDPVTGQMRVNTNYAHERADDQLRALQQSDTEAQFQHANTLQSQGFQTAQQARQFGQAQALQNQSQQFQAGQSEKQFGQQKTLEQMRLDAASAAKGQVQPTAEESKAANYAVRQQQAGKTIKEFETAKDGSRATGGHESGQRGWFLRGAGAVPFVGEAAANLMSTDEQKAYKQAQDQWLTSTIRPESGAVIGPSEVEDFRRIYFPSMNATQEEIDQKAQARAAVEAGMVNMAGRAYAPAMAQVSAAEAAMKASHAAPPVQLKIEPIGAPAPASRASGGAGPRMLPKAAASAGIAQPYQDPVTMPGWGIRLGG